MDEKRRRFMTTAAAASTAAATGLAAAAGAAAAGAAPEPAVNGGRSAMLMPTLPDISFAQREPFLDRERARRILEADGLDAMVVGEGRNVFHATNFFPLLERMSMIGSALAVIPRDPKRPVALVIPAFSYY
jgi:hypothetical protein